MTTTLVRLETVRHRVRFGAPLPFDICDAGGRLLLATGQVVENLDRLEALLARGAMADAARLEDEDDGLESSIGRACAGELPGLWIRSVDQIARVLREDAPPADFAESLERASRPVWALIERDPDLAIVQVVCHEDGGVSQYAGRHAVHSAIAALLTARRLGWDVDVMQRTFRAALTMNIGMIELQNRLAAQLTPLTRMQRQAIHDHPDRGVERLQAAGVTDADWLAAVAQHHEQPDGQGYPRGISDVGEISTLLSYADAFTAKFSPRCSRLAMATDVAARRFYRERAGSPMAAAMIKEFGLYPPGSAVQMASGETGVVMRRGESANTAVVIAVTNPLGEPLPIPQRRDTSRPGCAIEGVLSPKARRVRIPLDRLMQIAEG